MAYGPAQFGETGSSFCYVFPFTDQITDNFASLSNPIVDVPGMDGGFDMYGVRPGDAPVGVVSVTFRIFSDDQLGDDITTLRDLAAAMASWGVQRLYYTPAGAGLTTRWCYARLIGFDRPEELSEAKILRPITAKFAVADPFWYSIGNHVGDHRWGISEWGAFVWGGKAGTTSTSFLVTPGGTANTYPLIIIKADTPSSILTNPVITRTVGGVVRDKLTFTNTQMTGNPASRLLQTLRIDVPFKSVRVDAMDWYGNMSVLKPDWFVLEPGVQSTITITASALADITTQFLYYDRWR